MNTIYYKNFNDFLSRYSGIWDGNKSAHCDYCDTNIDQLDGFFDLTPINGLECSCMCMKCFIQMISLSVSAQYE